MSTLPTRDPPLPCAQCAKLQRGYGDGSVSASWGPVRRDGSRVVRHHIALRIAGRQERQTKTGITHSEAMRLLKEMQTAIAQSGAPSSRQATIGTLVEMYLENTRIKRSRGTYEQYAELYRLHIEPSRLVGVRLANVTTADCQKFLSERYARGQATGDWGERRVELMAHVLRAAFNVGMSVRPQLITWNPLAKLRTNPAIALPKVPAWKARALTHAQAMLLLDDICGHEHEHLYWLLLATGLRIGEALGLQWSDVDWSRRGLRVERKLRPLKQRRWEIGAPKTDSSQRWVPLVDDAITALEAQQARKIRRIGEDFIFVDQLGEPYTQDSVRSHMVHIGHKVGIRRDGPKQNVSPHDLRRSAATFLHGQGVPLAVIQHILGHTSITTTMRYIDGASEDMLRQAQQAMEEAFTKMRATRPS